MRPSTDALKDRLTRYRQIKISVIGRRSGQTISIPVWFVLEGGKALSSTRAGLGHTVAQERTQEPVDTD
jgi:hypothetical protein